MGETLKQTDGTAMQIEWSDQYKLGIPLIDAEHKALADLVNHFFARSQAGASPEELEAILSGLIDKTREHFRHEENLLDRHGYPHLALHQDAHIGLLQHVSRFQEDYIQGRTEARDITVETVTFFRNWLLDHILRDDMPYRPYIQTLS